MSIKRCIHKACETLYWPYMATELKEYISKCNICLTHPNAQHKKPIRQHNLAPRPRSKGPGIEPIALTRDVIRPAIPKSVDPLSNDDSFQMFQQMFGSA